MSTKRRSIQNQDGDIVKTKINFEDFSSSPVCPHGPQICFERGDTRYYSCSAFRSAKECRNNPPQLNVKNKQDNKGLAQYLFTDSATQFFVSTLKDLNEKWILCIGAPSIHDALLKEDDIHSFLLDLDISMVKKYLPNSAHYNMCNHHFFDDNTNYIKFLQNATTSKQKSLTIITDPPFGARPEILAHVHELITKDFTEFISSNKSKGKKAKVSSPQVNIIWIAPYFIEGHIKKANPNLEMCDYQINYSNHSTFSEGEKRSRKEGSPIRLFTNFSLNLIKLPEPFYKYCEECQRFVASTNRHCKWCKACTSKDGKTYKHCDKCKKCVKPTWFHCDTCQTCVLLQGHTCLTLTSTNSDNKRRKKRKWSK